MASDERIKKQWIHHLLSYLFTHWYCCIFYFFLSARLSLSLSPSLSHWHSHLSIRKLLLSLLTSFNKKTINTRLFLSVTRFSTCSSYLFTLLQFLLHFQISNDFSSLFLSLSFELSVFSRLSRSCCCLCHRSSPLKIQWEVVGFSEKRDGECMRWF